MTQQGTVVHFLSPPTHHETAVQCPGRSDMDSRAPSGAPVVWQGRYTSKAEVEYFVAIKLSNRFIAEYTCSVTARDGLDRTCRLFCRLPDIYSPFDIVAIGRAQFYDEFNPTTICEASSCSVDLLYSYEPFLQERARLVTVWGIIQNA
ncbi:Cytokinin glycosidase [Parasponia andersonii]|uniref:Cytokinin glycosidase n=1 Tax=Parasponia andersonii TaxID=3476 RepID=A0A2P5AU70_PARAD|nr:Cytokinin glycosidase [Parasponia andersonii]